MKHLSDRSTALSLQDKISGFRYAIVSLARELGQAGSTGYERGHPFKGIFLFTLSK